MQSKKKHNKGSSDRDNPLFARERIFLTRPWLKSTGPRSALGKSVSRYNAVKQGAFWRFVRSDKEDFDKGCWEAEQAIAAFEKDQAEHPDNYLLLKARRFPNADGAGNRWCLFTVDAAFRGSQLEISDRLARVEEIRREFRGAPKMCLLIELLDGDALLQQLLDRLSKDTETDPLNETELAELVSQPEEKEFIRDADLELLLATGAQAESLSDKLCLADLAAILIADGQ